MLSQGNLVSNTESKIAAQGFTAEDLRLGVLPLSHVFGRTCDLYVTLATGAELALAASRETFFDDCAAVRPTSINAVPYLFDKCFRQLDQAGRAAQPGSLRQLLGGRVRLCHCGGAPLPRHVYRFFWEQEVPVLEGYGLTESSPVISDCTLEHNQPGTVGRPIPGVEVRIAEDGEILTRGPHVMMGYWNKPDGTAQVLQNGWLRTGDLGHVDERGFLSITGRKKEMILTAGGRNIFPARLEALLTEDPLVWQAVVVGEGRNYLAALIVLNRDVLASRLGVPVPDLPEGEDLDTDVHVRRLIEASIAERLRDLAPYEQVGGFAILPRPFSVERGELTAKHSLRRQAITKRFADVIDRLYR
jgi:long-chain acyl-CoA synthetase